MTIIVAVFFICSSLGFLVSMVLNFGLEFVYNLVQLVGCDFNKVKPNI